MDEFKEDNLDFYLPDSFKGLSKKYIMNCIFDKNIQEAWKPTVGDIIVGPTGNIFVISGFHSLHENLGGTLFFFGGGLCSRDGGIILNETYAYTLNKDGLWYYYDDRGSINNRKTPSHSSFEEFRFVPYPHELKNYKTNLTWK